MAMWLGGYDRDPYYQDPTLTAQVLGMLSQGSGYQAPQSYLQSEQPDYLTSALGDYWRQQMENEQALLEQQKLQSALEMGDRGLTRLGLALDENDQRLRAFGTPNPKAMGPGITPGLGTLLLALSGGQRGGWG